MKKIALASAGIATSLAVLAEGSTPSMDTEAAKNMVSAAQTGLSSLLTDCTPYVTTLFLAGLAIWAAFVIFRLIKRAFSRAA